jgi:hypothetical protein
MTIREHDDSGQPVRATSSGNQLGQPARAQTRNI